jgi:hypothetical protein
MKLLSTYVLQSYTMTTRDIVMNLIGLVFIYTEKAQSQSKKN